MKRILVCGGRDYRDSKLVFETLYKLEEKLGRFILIQGECHGGADLFARQWTDWRRSPCMSFPAEWHVHERAAGPIRNSEVLKEMKPDLVVAFPGGRGTADMVKKAKAAGVEVMEVEE